MSGSGDRYPTASWASIGAAGCTARPAAPSRVRTPESRPALDATPPRRSTRAAAVASLATPAAQRPLPSCTAHASACVRPCPRTSEGTRTLGRPKVDAVIEERIRELAAQGMGKVKIAKTLGVGVSLTQRVLA